MSLDFQRDYLVRLPLPLAQLYSRAHNAKDAHSRHDNTFYLFEATIKLAAIPAIACYLDEVEQGSPRVASLDRQLVKLALPSLGQWAGMLRELARHFSERPDSALHPLGPMWERLNKPHSDSPGLLALYRRIKNGVDGDPAGDQTCTVMRLIDSLVQYRNGVFGHGAARFEAFYESEMGPLLFPAVNDLLREGVLDPLGPRGARLMNISAVRILDDGRAEVNLFELIGMQAERTSPLVLSREAASTILPNTVALIWPGRPVPLRLDPLLIYRGGDLADEVLFLNRDRNCRQVEYLSYATGRTERDRSTAPSLTALLSRVTGREVTEAQLDTLTQQSISERPSYDAILSEPTPTPPSIIEDYAILAELGRGGMGVVYLARQLSLGRLVAIKMLPTDLAGDEVSLARFHREMRLLARCDHPNIVKVLESGTLRDGRHYYVMEYIPGCDVEQVWRELSGSHQPAGTSALSDSTWTRAIHSANHRTREKTVRGLEDISALPLPPLPDLPPIDEDPGGYIRRVATLIRDAARALQAVHDQNVIHRDVKPANLMLTPDGSRVVLMDFGLAKGQSLSLSASHAGGLLGTLRYAAPEQLAAASLRVGPAADVRGLGVTIWELLTRKRLFAEAEDERQLAVYVHDQDVPRLRTIDPSFDRDLEAIVARATERRVSDRIASPGVLADYLQLYLDGQPLPIRPPTSGEMLKRWARAHKPLVGSVAAAALVIAISATTAFVLVSRSRDKAVVALKDSEANAYFHTIALANDQLQNNRIGQAEALLDSCPVSERGWEWNYLRRQCVRPQLTFHRQRNAVSAIAFSPDGRLVASASSRIYGYTQILVWDPSTGDVIAELKEHNYGVDNLAFSPDGQFLASTDGYRLCIWDCSTWRITSKIEKPGQISDFDDNGKPETTSWSRALTREEQKWIRWIRGDNVLLHTPTDEKRLFALGPAFNQLTGRFAIRKDRGNGVAVTSRGDAVPDQDEFSLMYIFDDNMKKRLTVKENAQTRNPFNRLLSIDSSPDGLAIAGLMERSEPIRNESSTSRTFARIRIWEPSTGTLSETIESHHAGGWAIAFSKDGKWLAAGSGARVILWDAKTYQELGVVGSEAHGVHSFAIDESSQRLAIGGNVGTITIWPLAEARRIIALRDHRSPNKSVTCAAWGPGEAWIVAGYDDGSVLLWSLDRGSKTEVGKHAGRVNAVSVSRDGRLIVSAGEDQLARLHDVTRNREVTVLSGHTSGVTGVSFAVQGDTLVTSSADKTVRMWNTDSGSTVATYEQPAEVSHLVSSADGTRIAWSSDSSVSIADADTGKVLAHWNDHSASVLQLVFSPDGRLLASSSRDGSIRIVSVDGSESTVLRGHLREVSAISFDAGGKRLASGSHDGSVRIWDVDHRQQILSLSPYQGMNDTTPDLMAIRSLCFGPLGDQLLVAGADGSILVLDGAPTQSPSVAPTKDEQYDESLEWAVHDAARFESTRDWPNARYYLTRLIEAKPDDLQLRIRRGSADIHLQQWQEAVQDYSKAIELGGDGVEVRRGRARAWLHLDKPANTVADCDFVLSKNPEEKDLYLLRYLAHARLGDGKLADRDYAALAYDRTLLVPNPRQWWSERPSNLPEREREPWLFFANDMDLEFKRSPDAWRIWRAQGLLNAATDSYDTWKNVEAAFSSALGKNPDDLDSLRGRARANAELAQWDKVTVDCSRGLEKNPNAWELWYLRGRAHELSALEQAERDYRQSIQHGGAGPETWGRLAAVLRKQGKSDEAIPLYSKALQHAIDDDYVADLWNGRGYAYAQSRNWSSAIADLTKAVTLASQNSVFIKERDSERSVHWEQLALAHLGNRDIPAFSQTCKQVFARYNPRDDGPGSDDENRHGRVFDTLAFTCLHRPDSGADFKRLVNLSERTVEKEPKSADYRETLGGALHRANRNQEAIEQLNEAVKLQGGQASVWSASFLAMAHHQLGHTKEAADWAAKAKAQDPRKTKDGKPAKAEWTDVVRYETLCSEVEALLKPER
jgi:WD40 repeat protein/serine/threonine protein kinase/tetratricopeptide (TPR) repeat protein